MRPIVALCCIAVVVACAKSETPADTTAATATPAPAPPPPITLNDVAGKWNVTGKNETGDSTLVTYVFTATPDTTGWNIKFANVAKPVPVHVVSVAGDSIVIEAGPYASVLRKGVQVRTRSTIRLQNGAMVGTATAHYNVKTADSVRVVKLEGTKAP